VGDYGLVARLDPDGVGSSNRGLTPKYVSPEALRGQPSSQSDQYSLALVYQELLTGTFPYAGRTPQQLMLQHVSGKPDLTGLPPADQPIVAQALAKEPQERFGSCLSFVQALMSVASATSLPGAGMNVRRARLERSMADMNMPTGEAVEPTDNTDNTGGRVSGEPTQNFTLPSLQGATAANRKPTAMPKLVPSRRPVPSAASLVLTPAPISAYAEASGQQAARRFAVVLNPIKSVVPIARLIGMEAGELGISPDEFALAVMQHAAAGAHIPQLPGDLGQRADGSWVCQFPSTVPPTVIPLKLSVIRERWGVTIEHPEPTRIVLKKPSSGGGGLWGAFSSRKASGLEVTIRLPGPGRMVGEIQVTGALYGTPDREFTRQSLELLPELITQVRRELRNVEDRRRSTRIPNSCMVTLYPIHSDGGIDTAIHARCRDVSLGGLCVATESPLPTKYAYATFDGIGATAGQAILVRFLRTIAVNRECQSGGQYRVDL
jgi:hypothetical protein